ncbi:FAD assembly factor SdhE [Candidatus Erwinia haradaeae]|uniref:FAD assembly factor SdhE n=1 Tax=Candidatus Erwinia haradaeae TaxID=1922217 RepID=A0A803FTZ9_9GAMM|nr:FAD assembly factor SdhE [Candidatus Erwinia haradaeae]VFP88381.1 FAD assembly factor SdhE [Candidatus Erwinia haradaeae]
MDVNNKSRIYWSCHRGMRELDLLIIPFFHYEFDSLSKLDQQIFIRLLQSDDPDLLNWLVNNGVPEDIDLKRIVSIIQERHKERDAIMI